MQVDKRSPIPVYYQLKNTILQKIKNGEYPPDTLIPSERELSEKLGISRMTVRQALNQLVSEGVLTRQKGKGTFVCRAKFEQRNIMSFSEIVRARGLEPDTHLIDFLQGGKYPEISNRFGIDENQEFYYIKRLRLAGKMPVGIEEVYLPQAMYPGLEQMDLTSSLHAVLREKFMYNINYVDSSIEAAMPSSEEKKLLGAEGHTPVLRIESLYFNHDDRILFYERSAYRSDEFKYNVRVY